MGRTANGDEIFLRGYRRSRMFQAMDDEEDSPSAASVYTPGSSLVLDCRKIRGSSLDRTRKRAEVARRRLASVASYQTTMAGF